MKILNIHPPVDWISRSQFRTSDAPGSWIGTETSILGCIMRCDPLGSRVWALCVSSRGCSQARLGSHNIRESCVQEFPTLSLLSCFWYVVLRGYSFAGEMFCGQASKKTCMLPAENCHCSHAGKGNVGRIGGTCRCARLWGDGADVGWLPSPNLWTEPERRSAHISEWLLNQGFPSHQVGPSSFRTQRFVSR